MTGTVSPIYEPALRLKNVGVVPGHDLTSEAALAKLSYLLALPNATTNKVTHQMSRSLRGQMTEQTQIAFEHPVSQLPQRIASLTALGYAIARENVRDVQDLLTGDLKWTLNESDYSGNTPLVRRCSTQVLRESAFHRGSRQSST